MNAIWNNNTRVRAWAYLRLGMISDARQERKKAEDYYSKVLDVKVGEGAAQLKAKKCLGTPCNLPPKKKTAEIQKPSQNGNGQ